MSDARATPSVELDPSQRRVLALADDASAIVLGVSGSGKTTTLVELVARRLQAGLEPSRLLVLAGSRQAATSLRDRLAAQAGIVTPGPLARSMPSFAHAVLAAEAIAAGRAAPQLLSGAEQDRIIAAMLAGHLDDAAAGARSGPDWPAHLHAEVRELAGFRAELRELLAAAAERGWGADDLRARGRELARPEWVAAGDFLDELERLQRLERRGAEAVTAASLLRRAARAIRAADRIALPSLVVVDDAQELTEGGVVVLEALRARGAAVIALGDPDTTTGGFRGADASLLAALPQRLGFADAPDARLRLEVDHRHGEAVRAFADAVAQQIGTAGAGEQREASAAGAEGSVALHVAASVDDEARRIARIVHDRRAAGVAADEIAIVTRTATIAAELSGMLAALDVPVGTAGPTRLREEAVVDELVLLLALASGREPLTADVAERLLRGDLLGLDALAVRRLKRALRHRVIAEGGEVHVSGAELIREAIERPELLEGLERARLAVPAARRLARMLADARALASAESPAAVDEVLWSLWSGAGVAEAWRTAAVSGTGVERALANRRLDAVVALFDQVARLIERRPDVDTGGFVDDWLASTIDDDSLARRGDADRVTIGTPGQLVGREVDTVIVAGLQDGVWPNLRPRGSLLGANRLDGAPTDDDRTAVLHDELRTFAKAVSSARTAVVLTAVESDDEQPSPFVAGLPRTPEPPDAWHSLRSLVGALRARLLRHPGDTEAAAALRRLADEGVPGAHPREWAGLAPVSSHERLDALEPVRVSPSALQSLHDCQVDWAIRRLAGSTSSQAASFGSIVHDAVEHEDATDAAALERAIDARFGELGHESTWEAERQRADVAPMAAAIADYFQILRGSGWRVEAADQEARFAVELGDGAVLSGAIDWLEHRDAGASGDAEATVRIVDLKTGGRTPTAHPELGNLQLRAYQLAIALGGIAGVESDASTAARLFLPRLTRAKKFEDAPAFDEVREAFLEHLRDAVATMGGARFEAVPAEHCSDRHRHGQCTIHVLPEVTE